MARSAKLDYSVNCKHCIGDVLTYNKEENIPTHPRVGPKCIKGNDNWLSLGLKRLSRG